ncbi:MAG: HAD-IA family hydrolase [Patescibacteria group bacterium]
MDVLISGEDVTNPKPNPEGILTAMNRLKVSPNETAYIGDSEADMGAARSANVTAILVTQKEDKSAC